MAVAVPLPQPMCAATSCSRVPPFVAGAPNGESPIEASWRKIEKHFRLGQPKVTTRQPKPKLAVPPNACGSAFIPSASFAGHLDGYVYKMSTLGLGYHRDFVPASAQDFAAPAGDAACEIVLPLCLAEILGFHAEATPIGCPYWQAEAP